MAVRIVAVHAIACAGAALALAACRTPAAKPPLATPEERFSYALGAQIGSDVRRSSHPVDRDILLRGVEDGLSGSAVLSPEEISAALKQGVEQQALEQQDAAATRAAEALREGREFLAQNRARPGVV